MTGTGEDRARPFSWRFVTPLLLASTLNPVNSGLIATALVPIAVAMDIPVGQTSVLVAVLYLACAVAQPTAGKLADEFGPRRVLLAGIAIVLAGGVVGGLAQDLGALIVARVLIGIGTSAGYPSAMLLIRRRAAWAGMDEPPGGVLGGLTIAGTATLAVGPPIGGLLVGVLGWQAAFLVNIPFGIAGLVMVLLWIPRDAPVAARRHVREVVARLDVVGIAGFGGAMTALLVFLMSLPDPAWAALVVAVVTAGALVAWELRVATPFFDVRQLASNLALTRTYVRTALVLFGSYTVLFGLTQWLQAGAGYSAELAGLLILPMSAMAAIVTTPVARRNAVRGALTIGAACMLVASTGFLFLTTQSPVGLILGVTVLFGITVGTGAAGNQIALYTQARADQLGTAAGLSRTFGYLGSIASSTVTGAAFGAGVTDDGLHVLGAVLVGVSIVVLVMVLADRRLRRPVPRPATADRPSVEVL